MIGIALMFGLAFMFAYSTYQDLESFVAFLCIFGGFVIWIGFLELWVLIINLIFLIVITYWNSRGVNIS